MANDNNNINELVPSEDQPTIALELPMFEQGSVEADANTFDANSGDDRKIQPCESVSELKSALRSHKKTISRLQYDMQQLHAKWVGLEAEIGARETQTRQLNNELRSRHDTVARKNKAIKKRDRKIKSLKSEIRQRDQDYRELSSCYEKKRPSIDAAGSDSDSTVSILAGADNRFQVDDLKLRLDRSEKYADTIRRQMQDLIKSKSISEREMDCLSSSLGKMTGKNTQLGDELTLTTTQVEELQSRLDSIERQHQEEIRLLRFDLGEAQDTVVETEDMNSQLASDLIDAHGFKEELERMLFDAEEQSTDRVEKLGKKIRKLTRATESYKQKLTTKSEAISILLTELAKKTEQTVTCNEIEDVIYDIDERMSKHSFRNDEDDQPASTGRITRVLIGTVEDQVLRFPLFKDRLTIGRTKDNDIQIKAACVSRRHAIIQTEAETTRIVDWGSKNGVLVNSKKVTEHILRHGDIVMIGDARFRYEERRISDS